MALTVYKLARRALVVAAMLVLMVTIFREMKTPPPISPQTSQTHAQETERQVIGRPIVGAKQIMFVEGSCSHRHGEIADEEKVVRLDATEACALESAARANPETPIYLFHVCPMDEKSLGRSSELVQRLFKRYDNLFVWHESVETLVQGTVAEDFYKHTPSAPEMHDSLRYFLLWKYGGTFLELDFIFRKSVDALAAEFVTMDSDSSAANAALRLRNVEGAGKRFAQRCLTEVWDNYAKTGRSEVDPGLFSRVLSEFCGIDPLRPTTQDECEGLVIYPPKTFYPVPRDQGVAFYKTDRSSMDAMTVALQDSFGVRVWKQPKRKAKGEDRVLKRDVLHPLAILQRKHCPMAYSSRDFE